MYVRKFLVVVCVLAALAGGSASAAEDDGGPVVEDTATVSDPVPDLQAQKLVDVYGISRSEADQRVARQSAQNEATARYAEALGSEWAGAFVDQEGDGSLVVQASSEAAFAKGPRLTEVGGAPVVEKVVERSWSDLESLTTSVREALTGAKVAGSATYSPVDMKVKVSLESDANRELVQEAIRKAVPGDADRDDVVTEFNGGPAKRAGCFSTYTMCDAPLRGGYAMQATAGTCSIGFIVKSKSDGVKYVLTAGHCLDTPPDGAGVGGESPQMWRTRMPQDSDPDARHNIGRGHSRWYANNTAGDSGIVDIDAPGNWDPAGVVRVMASDWTTASSQYPINGVGGSASLTSMQSVLCSTGAMSDTRCGLFFASGQTWSASGYSTTSQGVVAYMETCTGDSGGPVYSGNLGYGIVSAYTEYSSSPTRNAGFGSRTVNCGATTWYAGLLGQMNQLNVELV